MVFHLEEISRKTTYKIWYTYLAIKYNLRNMISTKKLNNCSRKPSHQTPQQVMFPPTTSGKPVLAKQSSAGSGGSGSSCKPAVSGGNGPAASKPLLAKQNSAGSGGSSGGMPRLPPPPYQDPPPGPAATSAASAYQNQPGVNILLDILH